MRSTATDVGMQELFGSKPLGQLVAELGGREIRRS